MSRFLRFVDKRCRVPVAERGADVSVEADGICLRVYDHDEGKFRAKHISLSLTSAKEFALKIIAEVEAMEERNRAKRQRMKERRQQSKAAA